VTSCNLRGSDCPRTVPAQRPTGGPATEPRPGLRPALGSGAGNFELSSEGMTMRRLLPFSLMVAATFSLTSSGVARPADPAARATENLQVIEVVAKKYEFAPSPIRVKQGRRVQLKITAADHTHGFSIGLTPDGAEANATPGLVFSSPQDCQRIEKGQAVSMEFVAQTPGTYSFRCCVHCGWNHRAMKGQLVVEP
jgi:heme/copper-type cytochrome/quinol oxidase subunit 2